MRVKGNSGRPSFRPSTRKPWPTIDEVEYATARWVNWFNHHRLYEHCGDIPPVELETAYYSQRQRPAAG